MPFTRGAREVPNQTDLPPSLPDTSGWVRREPGDVIEAGTRFVVKHKDGSIFYQHDEHESPFTAGDDDQVVWTPPPVEPSPWEGLSTERDRPTRAVVYFNPGSTGGVLGDWWIEEGSLWRHSDDASRMFERITHVELVHTHNPETHVPVERALIDESARWVEWADDEDEAGVPRSARLTTAIVRDLAALADAEGQD